MAYAQGRTYYDADSHLMELGDWLGRYADPGCASASARSTWAARVRWPTRPYGDAEARRGDAGAVALASKRT